jgi:hypothetical protein
MTQQREDVDIGDLVDDLIEMWHEEPKEWIQIGNLTLDEFLQLRRDERTPFTRDGVLPERLHAYWRWLHATLEPS